MPILGSTFVWAVELMTATHKIYNVVFKGPILGSMDVWGSELAVESKSMPGSPLQCGIRVSGLGFMDEGDEGVGFGAWHLRLWMRVLRLGFRVADVGWRACAKHSTARVFIVGFLRCFPLFWESFLGVLL